MGEIYKTMPLINPPVDYVDSPLVKGAKISMLTPSEKNHWANAAHKYLSFFSPFKEVQSGTFENGDIRWFEGATLNVSYHCLDRHLPHHANRTALIWENDDGSVVKHYTYEDLYKAVCRFANVLKAQGIRAGDRICIYLPMIPEAVIAMLACSRLGAIHSLVFGGFSADALADRINDAGATLVITADEGLRGGKKIFLKKNVDEALTKVSCVESVIIVKYTHAEIAWHAPRDKWLHELENAVTEDCPPTIVNAETPLFILYTSGSTGKPKGVLHTSAGYLLYASMTHKELFDYQESDIYWCTADIGWITGHSYVVYGPLANAATVFIFEGTPTYPGPDRYWQLIDKHKISIFYTSPTALRALMSQGDSHLDTTERKSLRVLGTVGEPINPEVWKWYHEKIGHSRCDIIDTWWQTETGGVMISPRPHDSAQKPGFAMKPFTGIFPALLDAENNIIEGEGSGVLVIQKPWPGMFRTLYNNHARYLETYFKPYPGYYFTGDGALRDKDGDYQITGRMDDVLNVSGHRLGTAEIESAIVLHDSVAEAAVVGCPHAIKGEGIYAFVIPMKGVVADEVLTKEITALVRKTIGSIATLDKVQWVADLPKTRSGKIMRRLLRKIASGDTENLGDLSTLADPSVVEAIIKSLDR
jgi:acetyl-CoA synthetase